MSTNTTYNPDKLAEAIKAFGKERLEELREGNTDGEIGIYGNRYAPPV